MCFHTSLRISPEMECATKCTTYPMSFQLRRGKSKIFSLSLMGFSFCASSFVSSISEVGFPISRIGNGFIFRSRAPYAPLSVERDIPSFSRTNCLHHHSLLADDKRNRVSVPYMNETLSLCKQYLAIMKKFNHQHAMYELPRLVIQPQYGIQCCESGTTYPITTQYLVPQYLPVKF